MYLSYSVWLPLRSFSECLECSALCLQRGAGRLWVGVQLLLPEQQDAGANDSPQCGSSQDSAARWGTLSSAAAAAVLPAAAAAAACIAIWPLCILMFPAPS